MAKRLLLSPTACGLGAGPWAAACGLGPTVYACGSEAQPPLELVNVRLRASEGPQVSARTGAPARQKGGRLSSPRDALGPVPPLSGPPAGFPCWWAAPGQSLGGLLGGGALLFLWRPAPPVLVPLPLVNLWRSPRGGRPLVAWACA